MDLIPKRRKQATGNDLANAFLRDLPGTAKQRLALLEKLDSAGALRSLDAKQVRIIRSTLEMRAATEEEGR